MGDKLAVKFLSHVPASLSDMLGDEKILMRVPDSNLPPTQLNNTTSSASAGAAKTAQLEPLRISSGTAAGAEKAGAAPDSVQISSLSSKISELQSGSPEREAMLERLAAQVAAGSYEPDPAAIATKLTDDMLASGTEGQG